MRFNDVLMENGSIFSGEKISELVEYIIEKFADEKMSVSESLTVLEKTKDVIAGESIVKPISF